MQRKWDQMRIQEYIDDEIEESISLDYKGARTLAKNPEKRKKLQKMPRQ